MNSKQLFSQIIGNDHVKRYLVHMIETKAIGNSLLFAGSEGIGKSLFAQAFAKLVLITDKDLSSHPDVYVYRPEGKIGMHSIDSMRQFCEQVYMSPYQSKWKIFIIHDAERMLPSSANALLKTFEEPAKDSIIILLSSAPSMLLPTVISRCRTIRFHHLEETAVADYLQKTAGKSVEEAQKIAAISSGSIGKAVRLAEEGTDSIRKQLMQLLKFGRLQNYTQLIDEAKSISVIVEESRKQEEKVVRSALMEGMPEELTANQKQHLEKEIDGAVSLRQANSAQTLFEVILSWYRDLHLVRVNGDRTLLINRDYGEDLEKAAQRGGLLELEYVQKAISEAKLLLDRSTGLNIVIENLFLKLNLL